MQQSRARGVALATAAAVAAAAPLAREWITASNAAAHGLAPLKFAPSAPPRNGGMDNVRIPARRLADPLVFFHPKSDGRWRPYYNGHIKPVRLDLKNPKEGPLTLAAVDDFIRREPDVLRAARRFERDLAAQAAQAEADREETEEMEDTPEGSAETEFDADNKQPTREQLQRDEQRADDAAAAVYANDNEDGAGGGGGGGGGGAETDKTKANEMPCVPIDTVRLPSGYGLPSDDDEDDNEGDPYAPAASASASASATTPRPSILLLSAAALIGSSNSSAPGLVVPDEPSPHVATMRHVYPPHHRGTHVPNPVRESDRWVVPSGPCYTNAEGVAKERKLDALERALSNSVLVNALPEKGQTIRDQVKELRAAGVGSEPRPVRAVQGVAAAAAAAATSTS